MAKKSAAAAESTFEKKITEQTAATAFQLAWGLIKKLGLKGWEKAQIQQAMKKYAGNFRQRHGQVSVLGMSQPVPLHQIYTAVRVIKPDYLRDFTAPDAMEESFRESQRRHAPSHGGESRDGIDVANETPFLNVLGAPGAGKSTFLRRLGQEAMLARATEDKVGRDKRLKSRFQHPQLPVLLELRQFRSDADTFDLVAALTEEFETCGFPESRAFVESALKNGLLLVILDGLDEVPDARLDEMISAVRDLVDRYGDNRFVTSCRTAQYKNYFQAFTDVVLADFSDEQIEQFAKNWFATADDIREKTHKRFLEQLDGAQNASAKELARTPLLLTFLCLTFDRSQQLPPNRALLYRSALDILLKEWAAEKRVHNDLVYQELHYELELDMLGEMAAKLYQENRYFFTREEALSGIRKFMERQLKAPKTLDAEKILHAIERQQGLIVRRAKDAYSFSHLTIQEYLTARELKESGEWRRVVKEQLFNSRWRQVFLILAGIGDSGDLIRIMAAEGQRNLDKQNTYKPIDNWVYNTGVSPKTVGSEKALVARAVLVAFVLEISAQFGGLSGREVLVETSFKVLKIAQALERGITSRCSRYSVSGCIPYQDLIRLVSDRGLAKKEYLERLKMAENGLVGPSFFDQVTEVIRSSKFNFETLEKIHPLIDVFLLVIECRNAAYRIDTEAWDNACDHILTLPDNASA